MESNSTNTNDRQLDDGSALLHAAVARASLSSNSDAASATGAIGHAQTRSYPYDFFAGGKVPKTPEEAKVYWKYRWDAPMDSGIADIEPADGHKMRDEMMKMKSDISEYVSRQFDARAIDLAASMNLKFENGMCYQQPKTAQDLQKLVGELSSPTSENVNIIWKLFYTSCQTNAWTASVIDGWLRSKNCCLISPSEERDAITGKRKGRTNQNGRGGWTIIATTAVNNRRRYYTSHLFRKQGWKVMHCGPKGSKNTVEKKDTEKQLNYQRIKLEGTGDAGKEAWLATKV